MAPTPTAYTITQGKAGKGSSEDLDLYSGKRDHDNGQHQGDGEAMKDISDEDLEPMDQALEVDEQIDRPMNKGAIMRLSNRWTRSDAGQPMNRAAMANRRTTGQR